MRISELSRRTATPLSAVKYYQREGLLPEGERTAPNQVDYDDRHIRRVRLIRALLETGGLSIAATRRVIDVLDADEPVLAEAFEAAQHAMSTPRTSESAPSDTARARIDHLAHRHGWVTTDDNPGIDVAARALDGLHAIGFEPADEYLDAYAAAAAGAAHADLAALTTRAEPDAVAELMVVGTVLGDPLFAGLRRLAHQDATHELFPVPSSAANPAPNTTPKEQS